MPKPARHAARVLAAALAIVQLRLSVATIYQLTMFALGARRRPSESPAPHPMNAVVLVPAHDEQAGVAATVASLRAQDHSGPSEVIVIADNCTDATARVAAAAGATVWERSAPHQPGKPAALAWALDRLARERPHAEAVVVVDADCLASRNLLAALTAELRSGADAAQAVYRVANADESSQAALRAAGFALKHDLRARGRSRLGLSPGLFGTGMAFTAATLAAIPLSQSVTEDTELFVRLVEGGRRVAFAENAAVISAMPTNERDAVAQQLRWETGNAELARTRLARLLWRGLIRRDREQLGAAAELALPSQSAQLGGEAAVVAGALLLARPWLAAWAAATLAGQLTYVIGGLAAVGDAGLLIRAGRDVPRFVVHRLRTQLKVSLGGGARSWERTVRVPAGAPAADSDVPSAPPV